MTALVTTGADLPPEVISNIVLLIPAGCKRGLAACSLTCRYWEKSISPSLFHTIVVRNYKDLSELETFLSSKPELGAYIKYFKAAFNSNSRQPWLHHLRKISTYAHDAMILLEIDGAGDRPQDSGAKKLQSLGDGSNTTRPTVHYSSISSLLGLPRNLPYSTFPVHYLCLIGVNIKRRMELIRFVLSMPTLDHLSLIRISFADAYELTQPPIPHRASFTKLSVSLSHCKEKGDIPQLNSASSFYFAAGVFPAHARVWTQVVNVLKLLIPQFNHVHMYLELTSHSEHHRSQMVSNDRPIPSVVSMLSDGNLADLSEMESIEVRVYQLFLGPPVYVEIILRSAPPYNVSPSSLSTFRWNDFRDAILSCSLDIRYIIKAEESLIKWILLSELEDMIMHRALDSVELVLTPTLPSELFKHPRSFQPRLNISSKDTSVPGFHEYTITLSMSDRVEWAMLLPDERELFLDSLVHGYERPGRLPSVARTIRL